MQRRLRKNLAALCGAAVCCVCALLASRASPAGEEPAKSQPAASATTVRTKPTPDYKIVFWYQGGQLKARAYDVRKGQYTKAVDNWVRKIHYDSTGLFVVPGPMATVREVYLEKETGATEAAKLAAAIERLRLGIEGANRQALMTAAHLRSHSILDDRASMWAEPASHTTYRYILPPLVPPGAGGLGAGYGPTPYSYPVPYPYVRPHP